MAEQYFMGLDGFIWFVGVVENRNDPAELGRVQVRCLGYHTEDLSLIPTADLPWAHVMHPVTDPSMQGLGNTPSFLVEGSWVVGFFRDAREKQQPVIMGTLPGYPEELPDTELGFNDPTGTYPNESKIYSGHGLSESDVSRLARGIESEEHEGLKLRRRLKQDDIPIATKPHIPTVSDSSTAEERTTWSEPDPKSVASNLIPYPSAKYPYNHVYESEAGHIQEIDDTPGGERLMQQHSTGSFQEIHPDGSKVVKVVGDNYEIIAGSSNVLISGDVSLTMSGNVRELVKGDYVLEVEGNYTQNIHGEHEVKVGKNRAEEILGNHAYNIGRGIKGRVGEDVDSLINGNETRSVGGSYDLSVAKDLSIGSLEGDIFAFANNDFQISTASGIVSMKAGDKLDIRSAKAMTIKTEANGLNITSTGAVTETFSAGQTTTITGTLDLNATVEVDVDAATINLN
tara:strand:+ start:1023 stop:2390 length:1368 start_codon:yes stop_codon:yes gene_type:complete